MDASPNVRAPHNTPCQHCGMLHGTLCPAVAALEYHPDGSLKRVEFRDPAADPTQQVAYNDARFRGISWVRTD